MNILVEERTFSATILWLNQVTRFYLHKLTFLVEDFRVENAIQLVLDIYLAAKVAH